jgi:hypothetical protein
MRKIENPEFKFVKEVGLDMIATHMQFEIYKNKDKQYLVVNSDESDKTITFYKDSDHLESVFSDDFSKEEIQTW